VRSGGGRRSCVLCCPPPPRSATFREGRDPMSLVALVTGASRGIGRAIALDLAGRGFDVGIVYRRDETAAAQVAAAIEALGRRALPLRADVASPVEVAAMFRALDEGLGPVDALVCAAGITRDTLLGASEPADFDAVYAVNLGGVVNACREA